MQDVLDIIVTPLSSACGAEIRGVDLTRPLSKSTVQSIKDAWGKHLVLVFRDATITQEQQLRFAAYFGELIFKAVRRIDAHAMFFLCDGIENGLAARVDEPGYNETGAPAIDIDLEIDLGENRVVNLFHRAGKDVEDGRARLRVQA